MRFPQCGRTGCADVSDCPACSRRLRPEQWTKNLIVFAALIFGQRLFDSAAVGRSLAAFVDFLCPVGRRLPGQRRQRSRSRSPAPAQTSSADCRRQSQRRDGAHRCGPDWCGCAGGRVLVAAGVWLDCCGVPGIVRSVFTRAEARRHSRRADHCHWIRPPRRGGCRGRGGSDESVAARLHDPAGSVPRSQQAPSRIDAACRQCRGASPHI